MRVLDHFKNGDRVWLQTATGWRPCVVVCVSRGGTYVDVDFDPFENPYLPGHPFAKDIGAKVHSSLLRRGAPASTPQLIRLKTSVAIAESDAHERSLECGTWAESKLGLDLYRLAQAKIWNLRRDTQVLELYGAPPDANGFGRSYTPPSKLQEGSNPDPGYYNYSRSNSKTDRGNET